MHFLSILKRCLDFLHYSSFQAIQQLGVQNSVKVAEYILKTAVLQAVSIELECQSHDHLQVMETELLEKQILAKTLQLRHQKLVRVSQ